MVMRFSFPQFQVAMVASLAFLLVDSAVASDEEVATRSICAFANSPAEVLPVDQGAEGRALSDALDSGLRLSQDERLPSLAILVLQKGKVVTAVVRGYSDVEEGRKATFHTAYRVGSLSKSLTATAAMALVANGKVGLDDPVESVLAPYQLTRGPGVEGAVTLRHLLSMRAGVAHGWVSYSDDVDNPHSAAATQTYLDGSILLAFPPGEVYEYSNFSMGVVDLLMENIANRPLDAYLRNSVFLPLGMRSTGVPDSKRGDLARGYSVTGKPIEKADVSYPIGGLGLAASITDLGLFGEFSRGARLPCQEVLLPDDLRSLMHSYRANPEDVFGLGWFGGNGRWVSNGSVGGGNSHLSILPESEVVIAVLTNATSSSQITDRIADGIAQVFRPQTEVERRAPLERYLAVFETPYAVDPRLQGEWVAEITTETGVHPIRVRFDQSGAVRIGSPSLDWTEVRGMSFNQFEEWRGYADLPGRMFTPVADEVDTVTVALTTKLDGDRLFGYLSARYGDDRGGYAIPFPLDLHRLKK